jgi:hypothetical protein
MMRRLSSAGVQQNEMTDMNNWHWLARRYHVTRDLMGLL